MHGIPKLNGLGSLLPLYRNRFLHDCELAPLTFVEVLVRMRGVGFLDIEVCLIDSDDSKAERHAFIVAKSNSWQCRLPGSECIPAGRDQVHRLAQGRKLDRAMRVVR